jgi:hypothetical protein
MIIASVLAASLIGSPTLTITPTVPPSAMTIDVVTVLGSGCPTGTAAVAVSPDNTAFTVTYSQYTAQVGLGATPTDFRKNCQLNLKVNVPSGFTYAISEVNYRGFASLASGATGLERANYYFQGSPLTGYISHPFAGPLADDWQANDTVDIAALVFAPCGAQRNLNINTELRVAAGTSDPTKTTSFMTMDSTDGSLTTIYHFTWLKCP